MAGFDPINLGSVADDRTGDDFRAGGTKLNTMLQELFGVVDSIGIVFVAQESDFPIQDSSTITLSAQTQYIVTAPITTAKSFTVLDAAVLTSSSTLGPLLTYTGTGSMFNITDASFVIRLMQITHPNAQGYNFTDTVGGTFVFLSDNVRHLAGTKYGTFNDPQTMLIQVGAAFVMDQGIEVTGSNILINSIDKLFIGSTSATFKAIDLGSSIAQTTEFRDITSNAPSGAFGISGLVSSGNIPTGRLAMVTNCEFGGGMTALENITNEDIRWSFNNNTPIPDTIVDAMVSLNDNSTETVIAVVDTPVLTAGTWVCERDSLFTCTTGGRITYVGERDIVLPIDITVTVNSASGTNKDIHAYLALNGTVIANSGKQGRVGATDPQNISVLWQLNMAEDDYLEVFLENNTDTINLVASDAILRAR
jgi:hypothetical protein